MEDMRITSAHTALMEQFPIEKGAVEIHNIIENPLVQNKLVVFDAGEERPEHAQDSVVIVTLINGSVEFTVNGKTEYMHGGDVIYMAPGELHSVKAMEQSYLSLTLINAQAVDCLEDEEAEEKAAEIKACNCNCK
ncbi:AraC-like regulator [Bifidobacterium dolichotidis]|uniref:AraC-like regulator n=1 Tax=Bifidobacterium dolichotidis TaxID=2306976 RepID=A0A430FQE4_9BIFI|nr:cupin domain-containing protein [Bifidobacterium dolichotidis]RSX55036.1 AraC-like regulator [Bifidobacterium dolichotidis]